MNYSKFKKSLIEKGITDEKGVKSFTTKLALMVLILGLGLAVVTGSIINFLISIVVLVCSALVFFFSLDYAQQDKDSFDTLQAYVRKWWVSIPVVTVIIVLLVLFNFI